MRRIRATSRELVLPLVKQYMEQGFITFPQEELARQIDHIIREEGAKPVLEARKIQSEMEAFLSEKLGIPIKPRQEQNDRKRRRKTQQRPIGSITKMPGQGWGYGMSGKGMIGYYRDPVTGNIVWTDQPLEYQFRKRADLSTLVWKAVEEQEAAIMDVVQGGIAAGRNVKQVASDLETFINYPNGGERVVGRWMGMFPDTKQGVRDAFIHEYLDKYNKEHHTEHKFGSPVAKALMYEQTPGGATRLRPEVQDWLSQKMGGVKFDDKGHSMRGSKLPEAVKRYAKRLGKAGLDWRAMRIARTEMTAMLADEQTAIAENSDICSGEMDFVMDKGRDHWNCNCEKYAAESPWRVDDPERPEIPVHPSCMCEWRPRLKTDEEIIAAFREEMAEDLEAIEGTEEQRKFLEQIDESAAEQVELTKYQRETFDKILALKGEWIVWTCKRCGYTEISNSQFRNAYTKCGVCGGEMETGETGKIIDFEKVEPLLTRRQRDATGIVHNTVKDHLKEHDWSGTLADLQGKPIIKNGEVIHHDKEMQDSYNGLRKAKRTLEGSLRNPNLDPKVREYLTQELNQVNIYVEKIETLFRPYGGITWKKEK